MAQDDDRLSLIRIPGLQEIDALVTRKVHDAVLLSQPPRPRPGSQVPEWLGLAGSVERVAQNRLDQVEGAQGKLAVDLDQIALAIA